MPHEGTDVMGVGVYAEGIWCYGLAVGGYIWCDVYI